MEITIGLSIGAFVAGFFLNGWLNLGANADINSELNRLRADIQLLNKELSELRKSKVIKKVVKARG
jgi:hypothetical protein